MRRANDRHGQRATLAQLSGLLPIWMTRDSGDAIDRVRDDEVLLGELGLLALGILTRAHSQLGIARFQMGRRRIAKCASVNPSVP
jgi:hypothetical protein